MRVRCRSVLGGLSGSVFLMAALTSAAPAAAQADADRATARALGLDGSQALDNHDYPTAEDRFRRADRLVHAPTLMLGLARALAGEGKLVEATETYSRILREGVSAGAPEPFKRALGDARKEVDEILPKLGSVTIVVSANGGAEVANASALLDGNPLNSASMGVRRVVDPGPHTLKVMGDGFRAAEVRFVVPEGRNVNEPVTLEREPSSVPERSGANPTPAETLAGPTTRTHQTPLAGPPRETRPPAAKTARTLAWVALGVGGAGLLFGAATGFAAMSQHSDLDSACKPKCPRDKQSDLDAYHTMATLSDVGFAVAGAGLAAGVVLFLARPTAEGNPGADAGGRPATGLRLSPVLGPGFLGAAGQF